MSPIDPPRKRNSQGRPQGLRELLPLALTSLPWSPAVWAGPDEVVSGRS